MRNGKPLHKKIFKFFRSIITLRFVKKYLQQLIKKKFLLKMVEQIENQYKDQKTVYIFQHQFFDATGSFCFNGGAERYVVDLADMLHNQGYKPILIQWGDKKLWHKTVKNLEVFGIPVKDNLYVLSLRFFKRHQFVIYSGYVNWGKKIHPNILISHGITWDAPSRNMPIKNILKYIKDVDHLVSVDTNTISWLRSTFPTQMAHKVKQLHYIGNYVDASLYKPLNKKSDEKIKICFPRRCSSERGYWLMSSVLPPIMKKYPNVEFDFVGFAHGEKIENDIKRLVSQFPNCINHYVLNPDEMVNVYQKSDISLVPTLYSEGTSLSCLEAMACGNAVIATNIGGLPNLVIDGYNGLLINPDEDELLMALDRVIFDKDLRDQLMKNAVDVAASFDKNIWIEKWNKVIFNIGKNQ